MISGSEIFIKALLILIGYLLNGGMTPVQASSPNCPLMGGYQEENCYYLEETQEDAAKKDESKGEDSLEPCPYYDDYSDVYCKEDHFEIEKDRNDHPIYGKDGY